MELLFWTDPWAGEGCGPQMAVLGELNGALVSRTAQLLAAGRAVGRDGRCDYNLTLIK